MAARSHQIGYLFIGRYVAGRRGFRASLKTRSEISPPLERFCQGEAVPSLAQHRPGRACSVHSFFLPHEPGHPERALRRFWRASLGKERLL